MVSAGTAVPSIELAEMPFDAGFLGGPVVRLELHDGAEAHVGDTVAQLASRGTLLAFARIPEERSSWMEALEAASFRRIETLVSFERQTGPAGPLPPGVRLARPGDAEACVAIATDTFTFDRYHADPRIDDAVADAIKAAWVRNDLAGRSEANFVIEDERGKVAGFNLCLLAADAAVIDLIAVGRAHQSRGYGRRLVEAALAYFADRRPRIRVGTQADNLASIRLYERCGFRPVSRQATFHWSPAT